MTRMIIADDESVIIRGLERILDWESMGIEIVGKFTDGSSALNGILALRPDIALLDISMPHLSGIEVLEKVREMGIPVSVIFISGFQDFEYVQAALHHGASDYLLKPLIRSEISAAITRCLPYSADLHDPDSGVDANDEMPSSLQYFHRLSAHPRLRHSGAFPPRKRRRSWSRRTGDAASCAGMAGLLP